MSEIDGLLKAYCDFVHLPWDRALSGPEKVWFVIYDPAQERRLRLRLPEFEMATKSAGHPWAQIDLTDSFAEWMANHEYREAYFEQPEDMEIALSEFTQHVVASVSACLTAPGVDETTVVAITGLASLFGLTYASTVLEHVNASVRGRLLVFFPGRHDGSNYRLLDARDGWNYLAIPITANDRK